MDEFNVYSLLGDDANINQQNVANAQQRGAAIGSTVGQVASAIPIVGKALGPLASALGGWIAKRKAMQREEFLRNNRVTQMGDIVDYRMDKARENTLLNQVL